MSLAWDPGAQYCLTCGQRKGTAGFALAARSGDCCHAGTARAWLFVKNLLHALGVRMSYPQVSGRTSRHSCRE
jgi:hypothetical protein